MSEMKLTVMGCRGSIPVGKPGFSLYGGDTTCFRVDAGPDTVFLDAGSGLIRANTAADQDISILLTHTHMDHLIGLPMFPALLNEGIRVHIYGFRAAAMGLEEQISRFLSPPLWPITIYEFPAEVVFHELDDMEKPVMIEDFEVDWMQSHHPGGCAVYRLRREGKTIVLATDFEHLDRDAKALTEFAKDADLLLYDAQYTQEGYESHRGYGHSTAEAGLKIAEACGAKRLWLIHHAPWATDEELQAREIRLRAHYAKQGESVRL